MRTDLQRPIRQAALSGDSAPISVGLATPWAASRRGPSHGAPRKSFIPRRRAIRRPGSGARCLDLDSPSAAGAVIDQLRIEPVLIVLPSVYALMAAPTKLGIAGLNRMKRRLPGKNYGTAAGELSRFWDLVDESTIPDGLDGPRDLESTRDVFFRCRVSGPETQSSVVRDGTHQTLILGGRYRSLMSEIEAAFAKDADPRLFGGHRFSAPLITSCNISGDPLGSITDEERGREFIDQQGVGLWIRGSNCSGQGGSYPILELEKSGLSIQREGGDIRNRELYQRFRKRH